MEQYFVIKGGIPLVGEVEIGGAKNAALAILAAAIMTDETVTIDNLPNVRDINVLLEAMAEIGAKIHRIDEHTVKINGSQIRELCVEYEYIKKIRASYYLLGALLGKYNHAEVALPGGCDIGSRPIDLHLKGFRALGADVSIQHGLIVAQTEYLKGTHIYLDKVSVGATINIMMAAYGAWEDDYRKRGKGTACCGCGQFFKQHGREYSRRRYRCDPDCRSGKTACDRVCNHT